MNARIRNKLIQVARVDHTPISYRTLITSMELGLNMDIKHEKQLIGTILDEISEEEHQKGRPLLSALIISNKRGQEARFYKLCEGLGMGDWKELKQDENFLKDQIKKCCDFWQDDKNYKKYF